MFPLQAKLMTRHPLPSKLSSTKAVPSSDVFTTTTGSAHDYKHGHSSVQEHTIFKKAPSHLKVNHTLDTVEKVWYTASS